MITKKDIAHLAHLARLRLAEHEAEKLEKDLENILAYFKELEAVDTADISPLAGGTDILTAVREDEAERTEDTGRGRDQFPEAKGGMLKIPKIFE